jgi:hypothetical protein
MSDSEKLAKLRQLKSITGDDIEIKCGVCKETYPCTYKKCPFCSLDISYDSDIEIIFQKYNHLKSLLKSLPSIDVDLIQEGNKLMLHVNDLKYKKYSRQMDVKAKDDVIHKLLSYVENNMEILTEVESKKWSVVRFLLDDDYRNTIHSPFKKKVRSKNTKRKYLTQIVSGVISIGLIIWNIVKQIN